MEISNPPDYKSSIDKFPHRRALPFDQAQDLRLAPVFALGVADGFRRRSPSYGGTSCPHKSVFDFVLRQAQDYAVTSRRYKMPSQVSCDVAGRAGGLTPITHMVRISFELSILIGSQKVHSWLFAPLKSEKRGFRFPYKSMTYIPGH